MTPQDFAFLAQLLKERSGLIIGQDKTYLLETRLTAILREHNLAGLAALERHEIGLNRRDPIRAKFDQRFAVEMHRERHVGVSTTRR